MEKKYTIEVKQNLKVDGQALRLKIKIPIVVSDKKPENKLGFDLKTDK